MLSVGSTTVYDSIATDAFSHKRHLSPLLDVSLRSDQVQPEERDRSHSSEPLQAPSLQMPAEVQSDPRRLQESAQRAESQQTYEAPSQMYERLQQTSDSVNAKPEAVSENSSPRELMSRVSSATEYDTLPRSMHDSKLSPNISSQLMLSPDLAERVSAILNPSRASYSVPRLSFGDGSEAGGHSSCEQTTPREWHDSVNDGRRHYTPQDGDADTSYLDKYINNSSRVTPRESDRRFVWQTGQSLFDNC